MDTYINNTFFSISTDPSDNLTYKQCVTHKHSSKLFFNEINRMQECKVILPVQSMAL